MADETVDGLQDLLKSMDGLPLVLQKKLIAKSLRKAAEPIRARAAELAPDDPETPGSRIEESMSISVTEQTATGAIAKIGPSKAGFPGIMAELGTAHETARPFLRPAFDEKEDEAFEILADVLGDGIEEAFSE